MIGGGRSSTSELVEALCTQSLLHHVRAISMVQGISVCIIYRRCADDYVCVCVSCLSNEAIVVMETECAIYYNYYII